MALGLVTLNQTIYGKYISNVLCFSEVQEDSDWLVEFADWIRDTANDLWDNHCITNWFLDNLTVSFVEPQGITYSVDVDFTDGNLQGNDPGDGLPASSALLISTRYVGTAPNRGRVYFSGFGESQQSDGVWDNNTLANMKALVDLWIAGTSIQGTFTSLQILRRKSDVFPAYVAHPAQLATRRDPTRSQRRRNLVTAA